MPKECIHCHEVKSSKEYYGRETGCKECKKEMRNEWKKEMEEDLALLEEQVDKMSIDRKRLRRLSTDNAAVLGQLGGLTDLGLQQKETLDDVVERLEHLTIVVERLTKCVMAMVRKE